MSPGRAIIRPFEPGKRVSSKILTATWSLSSLLPTIKTVAPFWAKALAIMLPIAVPPPVTITFLPSTPNKALAFSEESKPDISIKCWDGKSDSSADRDPSEGEIKWFSNRDPYDFVHEFLVVQGSLRR